MKITTRLIVVASTGSAISAVASRAASNGDMPFSSMNRKMFSSTTIASSMTMPTIRTSASIVTVLSVKSSAAIRPKVEIDRRRDRDGGNDRRAPVAHEEEDDEAGEDAAEHEVHVDLVERRVDVGRLVADDLERDAGGQSRPDALEAGLGGFDDRHGVGARLPPHVEHDRRHAVETREGSLLLGAILGAPDVANADGRAVARRDDQVVELLGVGEAAHGAQRALADSVVTLPPGRSAFCCCKRVADFGDRQPVGGEAVGLDPDADRARQPADDLHFADAGRLVRAGP